MPSHYTGKLSKVWDSILVLLYIARRVRVKNAQAKAKVLLTTFPARKLLPKQLICITFYAYFESGKTVPHCLENAIFTPQPAAASLNNVGRAHSSTRDDGTAPVWERVGLKRQMEDAEVGFL